MNFSKTRIFLGKLGGPFFLLLIVVLTSACDLGTTPNTPVPTDTVFVTTTAPSQPTKFGGDNSTLPTAGPVGATITPIPLGPTDTPAIKLQDTTVPTPVQNTPAPGNPTSTTGSAKPTTGGNQGNGPLVIKVNNCCTQGLAWSPDGKLFAFGSGNKVLVYKADGTPAGTLNGHTDVVTTINWSPDGNLIATGSADNSVRYWKKDGSPLKTMEAALGHTKKVNVVTWTPDGQILASCSDDSSVKIWQTDGGRLANLLPADDITNNAVIPSCSWSPDGKILAISYGGYLKLRSVNARFTASNFPSSIKASVIAWSPKGPLVVIGSPDHIVRLWTAPEGKIISLQGHQDEITAVAWSSDGKMFASGSKDKTIRLWDDTGKLLTTLSGTTGAIANLGWSPDNSTLASVAVDGTVRLWKVK